MKYILILLSAAFLALTAYLICENVLILSVRREKLGKRVKIAHISDVHKKNLGKDNIRLTELVRAEKPDVIFLTGDMVSRCETCFSAHENMINALCSIAPVYMIMGNHEQSLPEEMQEEFLEMLKRTKAVCLRNETVKADIRGNSFNICGIEPPYGVYKKNGGYRDLDSITDEMMLSLEGKCPDGETILLAHNPLFGEVYSRWGADYTFSGHVHGGSVRLFGIGMLSPERKFFPRYSKGVYDIGGKKLCVSGGIGKPRAFNAPEIVVYEI